MRNLTLSSEGSPHKASQSDHGGGRRIITSASHRDQGGGDGIGLCDELTVKDGSSIKAPIVDKGTSFLLKIELISESHGLFNS